MSRAEYGKGLPVPTDDKLIRIIAQQSPASIRSITSAIWPSISWFPPAVDSDSIRLRPRRWKQPLPDGRQVWVATAAEWTFIRCEELVKVGKLQHGPFVENVGTDAVVTTTYRAGVQ